MKRYILLALLCTILLPMKAQPSWIKNFQQPTKDYQPWVFWYWMYGCVSDEGIRADLKAMKQAGIAGTYLMPIKDITDGAQYNGDARQLSETWWKRMDTVFQVADSLHIDLGIHISDGFALAGGPWITPEESMQKVVYADTIITGGKKSISLQVPVHLQGYYKDIAVYAYPADQYDNSKPTCSEKFPFGSSTPCDIIFTYDKPYTLQQVKIITGGNNIQAHRWKIYASNDGKDYQLIKEIGPARQGWQNTGAYATYSVPKTTARYYKFHWDPKGSDPGSEDLDAAKWKPNLKIAEIQLGSEPIIDGYEGKSGLVWRVSKQSDDETQALPLDRMINLTAMLKGNEVEVNLPEGRWHILRMGHTSTGHTNATGGGGKGLECDKFSRTAIRKQYNNWFRRILKHDTHQVIKRLHVDSWECGSQNWSSNFAEEFSKRRGYDLLPWLPTYAGVLMESRAKSDQVLRDVRLTIAELINEIFFDEVETLAKQDGMQLSTECVAPTMVSDGLLHYKHADYPMGEFWLNSPTHDKPNDMLDAISGAHIYRKNIVQAEGFTEVRGTWDETPAMLKPLLDRSLCMGINGMVYHVYTHNPWLDKRPGMTLDGIGTFFQRDNTWWNELRPFSDYITRCQVLLRYGKPVTDLAVYIGNEVPRRALLPERLTGALPGLFGEQLLQQEQERLANEGLPMEVSPVGVNHTKNMTKADQFTNPLHGYKYDSVNEDALFAIDHPVVVIPPSHQLNPQRLVNWDKVKQLKEKGRTVLTEPWTKEDLSSLGIPRDADLPDGVDFIHRTGDDADIYFLANLTAEEQFFVPVFRQRRAHRYLFDAMDGKIYPCHDEIQLKGYQSIFVVFTDQPVEQVSPLPQVDYYQEFDNNRWQITFSENQEQVKNSPLFDWSTSENPKIKYYSGHATYETTFKCDKVDKAFLDLGEVKDIATVEVNGINCGTSWMAPYRVDISKAVKKGKNTLKITVVNTWANALLGADNGMPPYEGIWTNGKYRRAEKNVLPAGLLGPIILEYNKK
ncbi:MAG: DNA-binding protein [Prevotella sp.]|nr:DNA-binding protein [Prevotella sp.]MBQ6033382.1 DNA-binding protein [Prevotella sp.]MBQ6309234.1 DNA-binding protein [Prevotella sp.]MBQ6658905.1 DNA-binding protein [Prevotella sp.]MBQ7716409.1 DNA-binding protein [Prevotella sp.]